MGKTRKLRKQMRKRGAEEGRALVICVGKDCCSRATSRKLVDTTRAYAAANHPEVHVEVVGCLHVCKKGPVAATYPEIEFKKRVDAKKARKLVDQIARRR